MTTRTFAVVLAGAVAFPASAAAAEVRVERLRVVYQAGHGEVNGVRITEIAADGDHWRVTIADHGVAITVGEGCEPSTDDKVVCRTPMTGDVILDARLGDEADVFTAAGTCGGVPLCLDIAAGPGDDVVVGSAGADLLAGGDGDDSLKGRRGEGYGPLASGDALDGGRGSDLLDGGREADSLVGGAGPDVLRGGPGFDTVSYAARRNPVRADLAGDADDGASGERDLIARDVEALRGSRASDVLTGDGRWNSLYGLTGDDVLIGRGGFDYLEGDSGSDRLLGGEGPDVLVASFSDGAGHVAAFEPGGGRDAMLGGDGNDYFEAAEGTADRIRGGRGNDAAFVDDGLDHVRGVESTRGAALAGRAPR